MPLLPSVSAASVKKGSLSIEVMEQARVRGKKIFLGDVARITGDEILVKRAEMIPMGFSPRLGKERMITAGKIESLIRSRPWVPGDAVIRTGRALQVLRPGQELDQKLLRKIFDGEIKKRHGGAEFGISRFRVRGLRPYPEGKLTLTVMDNLPNRNTGNVSLTVSVAVAGKLRGKIGLTGWIDRYERVVCVKKDLPRNTVLSRRDLRLVRLNVSRLPDNIILKVEEAAGKRLTQSVRSGKYLRGSMLGEPPLIKRGARVNIVARRGRVKVITKGIARRDGVRGKQIEVKNISSKKIVTGRVVDGRTVEVLF
jgi:flagella basal body P-ring formation protein FlgA